MIDAIQFIGNFHPVLVHLPIGFLLLAWILQWIDYRSNTTSFAAAVRIAFLMGFISAVLSSITGWTLASSGEYDETILDWHRWMGISVAVLALVGYAIANKQQSNFKKIVSIFSLLVLIITGHLGGTLTHGDGFLTKGFNAISKDSVSVKKLIPNVQEAIVYSDIIQPILLDKCGGCHSAKNKKGDLD